LICDKCFQALPTTDKPKHPAQERKLKDSPILDDEPVNTPDLESVKEDIKVKDGSPEKSNKEAPPKETDLDTILYAPVKNGRPQNQKDITNFFLRELALRKRNWKIQVRDNVRRARIGIQNSGRHQNKSKKKR
jgi:hypothetical protein